jgi:hypothetical protein
MILATGPQLITNADKPQLLEVVKGIGYGLVFAAVGLSTSSPAGAEYQFGLHQAQIYDSQFKGAIYSPTKGGVPADAVKAFTAGPQQYDFTRQATIASPTLGINQSVAISAEYQFGLHQTAIASSQIQSRVFPALVGSVSKAPIKTIIVNGQELSRDLTLQPFMPFVPVQTGWLVTMVTAGPQLVDLTLQPDFQQAIIYNVNAPWTPTTIVGVWQQDPTQQPARLVAPPTVKPGYLIPPTLIASPTPWDSTQNQGLIVRSLSPPPSHAVQPAILLIGEQKYDNLYPLLITQPMIYVAPPPFTGFWVQAVTAGWYGGRFRTPGDIFLLAQAADFSDSTVDYQPGSSNTVGYGWMMRTAATQAYDWLQSNGSPYLPPQDPLRRFVY